MDVMSMMDVQEEDVILTGNGMRPSYAELEAEVIRLKQVLHRRDQELIEAKSALDKYQAIFSFSSGPSSPLNSPVSPSRVLSVKKRTRTRLFGISAEPAATETAGTATVRDEAALQTYPKDEATRTLLENAIQANDFMKHLDGRLSCLLV